MAPTGTDPKTLSLSPDTNTSLYKEYIVVKEIPNVEQATVAPWFDQPGGGIQKLLPHSIDELLRGGYIVKK